MQKRLLVQAGVGSETPSAHKAVIRAQGSVLEIIPMKEQGAYQVRGAARGHITRFTKASRRRLFDLFNRLTVEGTTPKFLTLTFSGNPTPAEAKVALSRFTKRLIRKHPNASAVWRMEMQERGAPHFHLIVFNMPYYPQDKLQKVWEQCTREAKSIVNVKAIKTKKGVFGYVAKYVGKVEDEGSSSLDEDTYLTDEEETPSVGRWWGIVNKSFLPFADIIELAVIKDDLYWYLRWWMIRTWRGAFVSLNSKQTLWTDDAMHWIRRAVEESDRIWSEYAVDYKNSII